MNSIVKRAISLFDDDGIDAVWTYLNTLIMRGDIDEGDAVQIANMAESEA